MNAADVAEERFRANRFDLLSSLADDLAHEIKNPLNSIIVNLEVLKVRLHRADTDGAADRAAVIESEVRRLHQLVDRMLMLLRPDRHEASNLPLDSALDELMPLIAAQAKIARNDFICDCDASVFVPVRRDVLKFAVLNLIIAVHARLGEGGGTLSIRCAPDDNFVYIIIEAFGHDSTAAAAATVDAEFEHAATMAGALLAESGGRIETVTAGVSVSLVRARSM